MQQRHNHKRGFSLIEAAIVLGVVGLVIGGIWVGAAAVTEKNRQRTTFEIVTLCVNKMRMALKQVPAHSYVDGFSLNDLAYSIHALPEGGDSPYGEISIRYEGDFGGRDFVLRIYDMTKSSCMALVSFFSNNATKYGVTRIIFYSPEVRYTNFPIITSSITSKCRDNIPFLIQFNY